MMPNGRVVPAPVTQSTACLRAMRVPRIRASSASTSNSASCSSSTETRSPADASAPVDVYFHAFMPMVPNTMSVPVVNAAPSAVIAPADAVSSIDGNSTSPPRSVLNESVASARPPKAFITSTSFCRNCGDTRKPPPASVPTPCAFIRSPFGFPLRRKWLNAWLYVSSRRACPTWATAARSPGTGVS